jgi:hypothetical protein
MTGNEAIDYLTEQTARDMTIIDRQLAVITSALDYGYWADRWELIAYDTAILRNVNGSGADHIGYDGELDDDLTIVADNALAYLNDNGITPTAYDHGETDYKAGYGNSTARDGAARLDGAGGSGAATVRRGGVAA